MTAATRPTSEHTVETMGTVEALRWTFANLPADVANALTAQRDAVAARIANAEDLEELRDAERFFRLVVDLWHSIGYGYKAPEMRARLVRRAAELAAEERAFVAGETDRRRLSGSTYRNAAARADALDAYAAQL